MICSFMLNISLERWITAAVILAIGIVLGLAFAYLFSWLQTRARNTATSFDDILFRGLKEVSQAGFWLAGAWLALDVLLPGEEVVNRAAAVIAILTVTLLAARLCAEIVRSLFVRTGREVSSIFVNITWAVAVVIGFLVALGTLGISITPLLTALGVGGIAVALALQPTLANLFAGIQILAARKVAVGDYVKLQSGEEGFVVDITWGNTTIRQLSNNVVVVPNAKLVEAVLTNYYRPEQEMSVVVQVGVAYDSDLELVEKVTSEVGASVMQDVEGAVATHKPFIRFHTFAESSINFSVILRVSEFTAQYLVTHEFIKRLQKRYIEEGIVIPFPMRTVVMSAESQAVARR